MAQTIKVSHFRSLFFAHWKETPAHSCADSWMTTNNHTEICKCSFEEKRVFNLNVPVQFLLIFYIFFNNVQKAEKKNKCVENPLRTVCVYLYWWQCATGLGCEGWSVWSRDGWIKAFLITIWWYQCQASVEVNRNFRSAKKWQTGSLKF